MVLDAESLLKRMTLESLIEGMDPAIEKAKRCTECEECTERCPYGLPIPGLLREKDCCLGKEKSRELEDTLHTRKQQAFDGRKSQKKAFLTGQR